MVELPQPENQHGYPSSQLSKILQDFNVKDSEFAVAFGTNTCIIENGEVIYYPTDIERALYRLGFNVSKNHCNNTER